jgi:hypothetical protein
MSCISFFPDNKRTPMGQLKARLFRYSCNAIKIGKFSRSRNNEKLDRLYRLG